MGRTTQGWDGAGRGTADDLVAEARRALFVMFGFMAAVWALQLVNWLGDYRLDREFGLVPHDVSRLPGILVAPFLHFGWSHIEANSGPLFVFGFLAAYRGVVRFLWLTLLVATTSGLAVWLFQDTHTLGVGASGVIFGYFGYVVLRGLFDRRLIDTLIGVVMAASFAYLVTVAVPGTPGVSWLAHLGGLVGGMAGAYLLRDRRDPVPAAATATPAVTGAPAAPDPARAELHKELRDLGLL
ncbi:rhomboid family intramembrane serine protease [Streptomyces xanthochromogenes]|uniref:rhomboid family intramembrane serine protease n=1 Tax=Streptomyces xanthochromogenes TaxID=67384 RepID=UPI001677F1B2|nr:rhomboid family intramembrane serine protease [Streptomyces xanthochromogenes]GHB45913.1 rhomboid family intramembrane serine protease [Streptomyces xanthochromogenes]